MLGGRRRASVRTPGGAGQAGLEDFVFGKSASTGSADVQVIAICGIFVAGLAVPHHARLDVPRPGFRKALGEAVGGSGFA